MSNSEMSNLISVFRSPSLPKFGRFASTPPTRQISNRSDGSMSNPEELDLSPSTHYSLNSPIVGGTTLPSSFSSSLPSIPASNIPEICSRWHAYFKPLLYDGAIFWAEYIDEETIH